MGIPNLFDNFLNFDIFKDKKKKNGNFQIFT